MTDDDLARIGRKLAPEVQAWFTEAVGLDHPCTVTLKVYAGKGGKVFRVKLVGDADEKTLVDLQERRGA